MKTIWIFLEVLTHCMGQSIIHPITGTCQLGNPAPIKISPIPWWGSIAILILGIASWITAEVMHSTGLVEAARAMVYLPLGNIFGMSVEITRKVVNSERHK